VVERPGAQPQPALEQLQLAGRGPSINRRLGHAQSYTAATSGAAVAARLSDRILRRLPVSRWAAASPLRHPRRRPTNPPNGDSHEASRGSRPTNHARARRPTDDARSRAGPRGAEPTPAVHFDGDVDEPGQRRAPAPAPRLYPWRPANRRPSSTFAGTGITWAAARRETSGRVRADVYLDGVLQGPRRHLHVRPAPAGRPSGRRAGPRVGSAHALRIVRGRHRRGRPHPAPGCGSTPFERVRAAPRRRPATSLLHAEPVPRLPTTAHERGPCLRQHRPACSRSRNGLAACRPTAQGGVAERDRGPAPNVCRRPAPLSRRATPFPMGVHRELQGRARRERTVAVASPECVRPARGARRSGGRWCGSCDRGRERLFSVRSPMNKMKMATCWPPRRGASGRGRLQPGPPVLINTRRLTPWPAGGHAVGRGRA